MKKGTKVQDSHVSRHINNEMLGEDNIDSLSKYIANCFEMPYCIDDIKQRLIKSIPLPSVGEHTEITVIISNKFSIGLRHFEKMCNVNIKRISGLNEQDCEIVISGGQKNLELINFLAKGYKASEIRVG